MPGLILGYLSFGAAAAAFLIVALIYLWRKTWGAHGPHFLLGAGLTIIWALAAFDGHGVIPRHPQVTLFLLQTAMLAWVWFLWHMIVSIGVFQTQYVGLLRLGSILIFALGAAFLGLYGAHFGLEVRRIDLGPIDLDVSLLVLVMGLAIALFGLSLTETLYRGYRAQDRWNIKFLCLAMAGLFAYDVLLFGEGLIFRVLDPALLEMRGFVQALIVPFLIINIFRSESVDLGLGLSQRLVFGSTVILVAGAYLATMAIAAYYMRAIGGAWWGELQIVFFFGALLLLAVALLSGSFRSGLRTFLSHHVLKDKYDYRGEWLRFSGRLASTDNLESFEQQVIRALADIVDSPAGALWDVYDNHLPIAAAWNLAPTSHTNLDMAAIEGYLKSAEKVRNLSSEDDGLAAAPSAYAELVASLRAIPRAWVLIPLLHQEHLVALVLLTEPRSPRQLVLEDEELLVTAARQAAGLLAERRLTRKWAEARQFERFNQRYAFVAHDLKNLVSQLSLVVRNHERFGDQPEFRKDMIETIESAVARMEKIMARLANQDQNDQSAGLLEEERDDPRGDSLTDLEELLRRLLTQFQGSANSLDLVISGKAEIAYREVDLTSVETILRHLLQNAVEASGRNGSVSISLRSQDNQIVIEVRDNGPGMEAHFVDEELFKPFRSTKSGGLGIGAYQSQVLARELGGDLEAISAPGVGTTMRLSLPRKGLKRGHGGGDGKAKSKVSIKDMT